MQPSTMTEAEKVKAIIDEFVDFRIPYPTFTGGRFQTKVNFYFAHVTDRGDLVKIEICKPGGSKFFYKIAKE